MAVNHTLLHRIDRVEAEMTCRSDDCIQGRKPCPTPHLCLDLRHVVTQPSPEWGVEAALPPAFTAPPARKYREPIDWQLVGIYGAAAAAFL